MDQSVAEKNFFVSELQSEFLDETKVYFIEVVPKKRYFEKFDYILIKNFYTHTVNIVQFANEKWKCILPELKLMTDPDCDEEAEKYWVINFKQLEENGYSNQAEILRFYLSQESEMWQSFSLKEVKFLKENEEKEKIKYNTSSSRFEFCDLIMLNDREEMNQKNIEMMKNIDLIKLNFLK